MPFQKELVFLVPNKGARVDVISKTKNKSKKNHKTVVKGKKKKKTAKFYPQKWIISRWPPE